MYMSRNVLTRVQHQKRTRKIRYQIWNLSKVYNKIESCSRIFLTSDAKNDIDRSEAKIALKTCKEIG